MKKETEKAIEELIKPAPPPNHEFPDDGERFNEAFERARGQIPRDIDLEDK